MTLGRRRFLGTGAAAALAAALAPALGSRAAQPAAASFPYALSDAQWRERLSREEYEVLRREATERPYSSPLNNEHRKGLYTCAGCAHKLFSSDRKFDSGTGWPSFWQPCRTPWARPRTAPSAWSARRCIAPTAAAIWDTCSTTARARPACATA